MQTRALSVTQKIRIILGLTTLAMLIAIASLSSGCNSGQNNTNTVQTQRVNSPTASPSPTPSGSPETKGDTIIVIKDGSADINFKDNEYQDEPIFHSKFTSKDVVLDYLEVIPPIPSATPYHFSNPESQITINTGGDDKDIKITGKKDKVELSFDRDVYKKGGCTGSDNYCNPDRHVWLIRIDKQPWRACNPSDKCIVKLHTKDKSKSK